MMARSASALRGRPGRLGAVTGAFWLVISGTQFRHRTVPYQRPKKQVSAYPVTSAVRACIFPPVKRGTTWKTGLATVVAAFAVLGFALAGVTLAGPSDSRSAAADQYTPLTGQFTLSLSAGGNGIGVISGAGISCSTSCSQMVDEGTSVTVTATPDDGRASSAVSDTRTSAAARSTLFSLSGDGSCSGSSCTVVMDSDKAFNAQFTLAGGDSRPGNNSGGNGNRRGNHGGGGGGHDSGNFSLPGGGSDGGTGAASGADSEGSLAFTGFNLLVLVLIGIALLVLGTTLLVRDRMAQRAGDHS